MTYISNYRYYNTKVTDHANIKEESALVDQETFDEIL
jgi:hypothetical protein